MPGTQAGIEHHELVADCKGDRIPAKITCIDYCLEKAELQDVMDVVAVSRQAPAGVVAGAVDQCVDGIEDPEVVRAFAEKYELHPLAIEDVMHVPQRPKVETHPAHGEVHGRIFIVARMLRMFDEPEGKRLQGEQISIFLGHKTLLSFQEKRDGAIFNPISDAGFRRRGAGFGRMMRHF